MNYLFSLDQPLQSIFWPQQHKLAKQILLVLAGILTLALSAQISIPLKPVPLTFESATVILIGMSFGTRLGGYTVASFLAAGFLGAPIFAHFYGGIAALTDPTVGYLIAFFPAALLSGYLAEHGWGKHWFSVFCAACLSATVIFIGGVIGLATFVGWKAAYLLGVKPFLGTEILKLLAVSLIVPRLWHARQTH